MAAAGAGASCSGNSTWWKYDVFLNFRGEDTRRGFVSHLYKALDQKAINTFIDAEELRKGNDLSELLRAIQQSRLSIVVFSQNYASSTWCLKELVQIMECMDEKKQIVIPIFYQVDPSDVRKLKRSFAEAFAHHDEDSNRDIEEVHKWRLALKRATNLSGWDSRNHDDDAKLLDEIVKDTFKKLIHIPSSKANGLVGMDLHILEMDFRLCLEVKNVRVIGIWGMGGIGKTTIARAVYDEIACQFEACCFLENVKEGFSKHGAKHMQAELLSSISNNKVGSSDISNKGFQVLWERLGKRKLFLVLDDLDSIEQIEALLGKKRSFGCGSRIIITTRDKQLLSGVDAIYNPKGLSDSGALELFEKYAFRTNQPTKVYQRLSWCAIAYAKGLPLALKILGAFLDNKSVHEWQDVLDKIKKIPHRGILDVLRISFDGLDDSEKDIFLDIACFFKGMTKDHATRILDGCGLYPHSGLRVLIDRALITVSFLGTLDIHDLLQEMGREIVRQESIKEPGRRSRLWSYEDVHHVLMQNTATESIESLIVEFSWKKVHFITKAFARMTRLRLLKICYRFSYFDTEHLAWEDFKFPELRCLIWKRCPFKSLPSNFHPNNLVHLDLQHSNMEQLWEGIKPLEKLKTFNLSWSRYLKKTPDFTEAKNLEEIILEGCVSLFEAHPSISSLKNLVLLTLKGCKELKIFPSNICMKSLQTLILSGCSNLEKFPDISEVMEELSELYLNETAIKEVPSSINTLTGLVTLNLKDCKELKNLPSIIHMRSLQTLNLSGCSNLQKFPDISEVMGKLLQLYLDETAIKELPSSIDHLTAVVTLDLKDCKELKNLPSSIHMRSLQTLNLSGCSNLEKFPEISKVMKELSKLNLDGTAIKELPSSINNLSGLITLTLKDVKELKNLPSSIHMRSLHTLDLSGCSNLEKFPEISEVMEEMSELYLEGTAIKELPSSINNLSGLVTLNLKDCRKLKNLPSSIHMRSLQTLDLSGCSNLEKFPEISEVMQELSKLNLKDCKELKSLPSSIYIRSLQTFDLSGCSNLEKFPEILEVMEKLSEVYLEGTAIKELPSSINNLPGLVTLNLKDCRQLKKLPSITTDMKTLKVLILSGCSRFVKFLESLEIMKELSKLYLDGTAVKELPSSIYNLTKLTCLDLRGCTELSLSSSIVHMESLKALILSCCSNLGKFPETFEITDELSKLYTDEAALEEQPSSLDRLTELPFFDANGFKELKSFPNSIIHTKSLKPLIILNKTSVVTPLQTHHDVYNFLFVVYT